MEKSIEKLLEELEKVEAFVERPVESLYLSSENVGMKDSIKREKSLKDLVEDLGEVLREKVENLEIEEA